jgi:hypothetical protein
VIALQLALAAAQVAGSRPSPIPVVAAPLASVVSIDWRDAPLAPGRWQYRPGVGSSQAVWISLSGSPELTLTCVRANRQITVVRPGATGALTVHTTGVTRTLASSSLGAADSLLDEIASSRGRWALSALGAPLLVVPSWAEPARVIEDCRR